MVRGGVIVSIDPRCDIAFGAWIDDALLLNKKLDLNDYENDILPQHLNWFHVYYEDSIFIGWVFTSRDWNDKSNLDIINIAEAFEYNHNLLVQKYEEVFRAMCGDAKPPLPDMHMICYTWY